MRHVCALGMLLLGLGCAPAWAGELWGELAPGPYAAGFSSRWEFDGSRTYDMAFPDGTHYAAAPAPRPFLVNVWYPALPGGAAMPYGDYFDGLVRAAGQAEADGSAGEARLTALALALAAYDRDVACRGVLGKPEAQAGPAELTALARFFALPTAAIRGAPAAPGRFPVVIYHGGAGSSFEDNSVLCELLASHGYVVLGSAFFRHDGSGFNIESAGAGADFAFLAGYARRLPSADGARIGLCGHSAGAQAALMYLAQPEHGVAAVACLDTTQDYHSLSMPGWEYMTEVVEAHRARYASPLLFAADARACFCLADTLTAAPRYYLTTTGLSHSDYIAHGPFARLLAAWAADGTDRAAVAANAAAVRTGYAAVCRCTLGFFDAALKGEDSSGLRAAFAGPPQRDRTRLEFVPVGAGPPGPTALESPCPPTPRQVRPLLAQRGAGAVAEVLRKFAPRRETEPIYDAGFAFALLYELLAQQRDAEAAVIYRAYADASVPVASAFSNWAWIFTVTGRAALAEACYRNLLKLDPQNPEARQALQELTRAS